jgi:hypothetical protein
LTDLFESWSTPPIIAEEVHNQDVLLEESGDGAGNSDRGQSLEVPHLFLSPSADHFPRVRFAITMTEAMLSRDISEGERNGGRAERESE